MFPLRSTLQNPRRLLRQEKEYMSYPVYPDVYTKDLKIGDKTVKITVGSFSQQVSAAVLVQCGETIVHTTVALGRKVNLGYFPLSVEFIEKLYSAGVIKGSRWVKRDGKPTDDAILKARVIDRSLRPMFADGITNEVQVVNTVFSFDGEHDPDMLGLLGSGIALAISEIPFDGPLSGVRVGYTKSTKNFEINPTYANRDAGDLDLIVSGVHDAIVMVEAGANEIEESIMIEALTLAQTEIGKISKDIEAIVKEIGKEKVELLTEAEVAQNKRQEELTQAVFEAHTAEILALTKKKGSLEAIELDEFEAKLLEEFNKGRDEEDLYTEKEIGSAVYGSLKLGARKMIIDDATRPDGRGLDEIREIWTEVDVFPRTHGSAMFKRGATQAVTVTTLGNPSLGQLIESIEGEETRHYMHHYNMPPYASGEAGRIGWPKRREIGHGALAERALLPMIPSQAEFPYAIHVVSEIMSSNGSTSQASVCGSTLSLMAAGVPIKRPVAGIAMGLVSDGKTFRVLSDIQGLEDHVGDMDFKVAGSSEGITAIQMDIKLKGLPKSILEQALSQAHTGRMHIMAEMLKGISEPRTALSQFAPKIVQLTIPQERIGELIGPGGKMIKSIIEMSGADINVDEDEEKKVGLVNVSSPDQEKINIATTFINNMMRVMEVGEAFDGIVTRVESYGAFVEYLPGREGLVHVSKMSTEYVNDAADLVNVGDKAHVRISEIKEDGKIGLSMLTEEEESKQPQRSGGGDRGDRGGDRGGSRGGSRGGGYRGGDRNRGGSRGGDRDRGSRGPRR